MKKNVPQYNPKESISSYIANAESYILDLQADKYQTVLDFINEWLNMNLISLTEFKYMKESIILKNSIHNKKIIIKYIEIFNSTFGIELNINKNTDIDTIDDTYIINLLKHVLKLLKMDYKLIKVNKNKNNFYTIKKCC